MLELETVNFKFEYIEALTTRRMIQLGTYKFHQHQVSTQ